MWESLLTICCNLYFMTMDMRKLNIMKVLHFTRNTIDRIGDIRHIDTY